MEKADSEAPERNNMKKSLKNFSLIIFALSCCLSFVGCGNNKDDFNSERSRLILRLFDSLEKEDYESAKIQALKLQKDNPSNAYLANLIETCNLNIQIDKINKLIKEGKIQEAYSLLKHLHDLYPLNEKVKKDFDEMTLRLSK